MLTQTRHFIRKILFTIRKILFKNYFLYRVGLIANVFILLLLLPFLIGKSIYENISEFCRELKDLWNIETYYFLKREFIDIDPDKNKVS